MRKLVLLALVGLGAQLVDGSPGHGLRRDVDDAAARDRHQPGRRVGHRAPRRDRHDAGLRAPRTGSSATSTGRSSCAIGIPGAVGAFAGATFLSSLDTSVAAPLMSADPAGARPLRAGPVHRQGPAPRPPRASRCAAASWPRSGLFAGFVDATGGGGWGPVGTPAILASGRLEPRKVIGSIDTSEFLVVGRRRASASCSPWAPRASTPAGSLALLVGGLIAAPIAAWLVRHIPPRVLGSAVGGVIVLTNARTLLRSDWVDAPDATRYVAYALIAAVWAAAVAWSVRGAPRRARLERELAVLEAAQRRSAASAPGPPSRPDPRAAGQVRPGR